MTYYILISLCIILLIAYIFEITSKFSRIPGVILLLALGLVIRYFTDQIGLKIPDLSLLLPVMGTLGLVFIVLEGSLDLSIRSDKRRLIENSFASAVLLFAVFIGLFTVVLHFYFTIPSKIALLNAIPLGIISSAVAIPSSLHLNKNDREFIVYESSISDIIGILLFDFILFNQVSIGKGILFFFFEVLVTIIISVFISAGLAYMLHKIGHHVKYIIILTVVILVFLLAKLIHWPSLIVVLIFGMIMNNNHLFQINFIRKYIDFQEFNQNLKSFKQITGELTFLIRSFFFLIFGFYTSIADLLNPHTFIISMVICFSIFLLRGIFFKLVLHKPLEQLFYFAPRGLITILLFLSIPIAFKLPFMSEGLIAQIIFITILVMVFGNILTRRQKEPLTSPKTENCL
jgi:Kef-type K+ transport system membrane component KefB